MAANTYLTKIQSDLIEFFTYFKSDEVLAVAEDKSSGPFAFLVYDKNKPGQLLLSLAIDYFNTFAVTEFVLTASKTQTIELSDVFYISPLDGQTLFNEDAYDRYTTEQENAKLDTGEYNLVEMPPLNTTKH